jgi:hypothetical protein
MHGGFARPVRGARETARWQVRGAAGDVHDAPAAVGEHPWNCCAAAEEGAADIDLEHLPPRRGLLSVEGDRRALHARVVDEQVDRRRLFEPAGDVFLPRDVAGECVPPMSAATASIRAAVRPVTQTSMPASARPRAMFAPTPLPPPVTSATRPSSGCGTDLGSEGCGAQLLEVIRHAFRERAEVGNQVLVADDVEVQLARVGQHPYLQ